MANAIWSLSAAPAYAAFCAALRDPRRAQERILSRYIAVNAQSVFGREHGFESIGGVDDFRRRVPVRDYDGFAAYIDRVAAGEPSVLTAAPVLRLVPSSGSTRAAKLIPHTAELQREFNRAIDPWIADLFFRDPLLADGCAYWSISPVARRTSLSSSAVPTGYDDDGEYLGGLRKRLVEALMAVPPAVRHLQDMETFRYATLRFLLARRDLRLVSVWHPSFFELLLDALPAYWDDLCRDIARGTLTPPGGLDHHACAKDLLRSLRPDERRAAELRAIGPQRCGDLWPQLRLISAWGSGHAAGAAMALSKRFGRAALQPKGLLATEAFVTLPFQGRWPLAIRSHFFEFEDDAGRALGADELRDGGEYALIVTTAGGLWRYRLGDRVRMRGRLGRTPSLEFVGRDDQVVDHFGEKLSQGFVSAVLERLWLNGAKSSSSRPRFAVLAPAGENGAARYSLLLEKSCEPLPADLPARLDEALSANPHYAYCRALGQLQAPTVVAVDGDAYLTYASAQMARGQRLGDIKVDALSGDRSLVDLMEVASQASLSEAGACARS
jgi:hypothetical protein